MRRFWYWLLNRHEDGTKHRWVEKLPLPQPHYCEWDYCHCARERCFRGCVRQHSDGVQEVR